VLRILKLYIQLLKQENGEIMTKLRTGFGNQPKTGFNAKPKGLTQQPGQAAAPAPTAVPQPARTVVPNRQYTPVVTNSPQPGFTPFQQPKGNIFSGLASKLNPFVVFGTILLGGSVLAGSAVMNPGFTHDLKAQFQLTDRECSRLDGKFYKATTVTITKNILGVNTLNICDEKGLVVANDPTVKVGPSVPRNTEFTSIQHQITNKPEIQPDKIVTQEVAIKSSKGEDLVLGAIQGKVTYEGKVIEIPPDATSKKIGQTEGTITIVKQPYTVIDGVKYPLFQETRNFKLVYVANIAEKWGYYLGYNNETGEVASKDSGAKDKVMTDKTNLSDNGAYVTNLQSILSSKTKSCKDSNGQPLAKGPGSNCLINSQTIALFSSDNSSQDASKKDPNSIQVFIGSNTNKHLIGSKNPAALLDGAKIIIK
jgi:hypothetical protein